MHSHKNVFSLDFSSLDVVQESIERDLVALHELHPLFLCPITDVPAGCFGVM
jgi:hypothetical protein